MPLSHLCYFLLPFWWWLWKEGLKQRSSVFFPPPLFLFCLLLCIRYLAFSTARVHRESSSVPYFFFLIDIVFDAMAAAPPILLIYLNSDVAMERPYRTTLPASVDTLAELCQFLTSRIPPRPGEDTVGRGYRFLYSVLGKPLWRVKECVDAGTIVVSVGPGFLARRPSAITDGTAVDASPSSGGGAAAVTASTNPADLTTPDRLAATSRGGHVANGEENTHAGHNGLHPDASPSASPPVKMPVDDDSYGARAPAPRSAAAAPAAATASHAQEAAAPSVSAGAYGGQSSATAAAAADGERCSIDAAWPPAPSVRRPSQTDERDRLVSITLSTAARGARASSGGPVTQSTPPNGGADAVENGRTPAVRLFTPLEALASAAAREAAGSSVFNQATFNPPQQSQSQQQAAPFTTFGTASAPAATATSSPAGDVPRGMVFLAHEAYALPARPTFALAATAALGAALPHLQPLPTTSISSSLQYLLLRKWSAYQRLHGMAPADVIAGEALSQQFNAISAACNATSVGGADVGVAGDRPCRVVVSGPPRSGVSTTAAFLVRHFLRTLQFQAQHRLHNTLVLAFDFHLLFGPQATQTAASDASPPPPRVLLDLASLYQLVVRSVMDAVVAQRPVLREAGPLLSQLWDLVIKPNVEPKVAPNFTTYTQAAALVGGDVLARWTRLAGLMFPILQAACRTPEVPELRDAALDFIFYAIPAEVAASLNFSGLFYAIDGAEVLTRCYAQRVTRPAGDLGPLLHALTSDARTHLVLAWPSTTSPRTLFLPNLTAHVSTIGLATHEALRHLHFPRVIRSGRKEYSVETFLGCPGYLTHLYVLTRPFRKNLTVPTTAYSSYYQHNYVKSNAEEYAVRVDDEEVAHALDELQALVHTLPVA